MDASPGTGKTIGSEDPQVLQEQLKKVAAFKQEYIKGIINGEVRLQDAVSFSFGLNVSREAGYVAKIRLIDILQAKDGWTYANAERVLARNGFDAKDTIRSIRQHEDKVALFADILATPPEVLYDPSITRRKIEGRWPWRGKIFDLAVASGVNPLSVIGLESKLTLDVETGEVYEQPDDDDMSDLFADENTDDPSEAELNQLFG